ncbi:hypothetical protein NDU88_003895 [Pleurodeles waltl]|uniref:Secreted protein n=1 Tax=Pleurodeles waltl TaxID=8319 RepID=A0AAV7UF05_PLEWA|nr:hypothetical protein NDU88_003895 [Pleurodeles waltl]
MALVAPRAPQLLHIAVFSAVHRHLNCAASSCPQNDFFNVGEGEGGGTHIHPHDVSLQCPHTLGAPRIACRASSPHLILPYPRFSMGDTSRCGVRELSRCALLFWAPVSGRPPPGAALRHYDGPPRGRPSAGRWRTQDCRAPICRSARLFYREKGTSRSYVAVCGNTPGSKI